MTNEEIFSTVPVLETKKYLLRGMTKDDAQGLLEFMKDAETMKYITPDPVRSEAAIQEEIQLQLEKFTLRSEIPWVIVNKSNGKLIGKISLHKLSMWHKKAELGVVIHKEYQQQGVMTEVMEIILSFGFNTLELNRLVGDIFADNKGSEKILEKYGFIKEGVLRQTDFDGQAYHDTVVFSMLKAEYDARK